MSKSVSSLTSLCNPVYGFSPCSNLPPGLSQVPGMYASFALLFKSKSFPSLTMKAFLALRNLSLYLLSFLGHYLYLICFFYFLYPILQEFLQLFFFVFIFHISFKFTDHFICKFSTGFVEIFHINFIIQCFHIIRDFGDQSLVAFSVQDFFCDFPKMFFIVTEKI